MNTVKFESPEDEAFYQKAWHNYMAKKECLHNVIQAARSCGIGKTYPAIFAKPTPMKEYTPKNTESCTCRNQISA